MYGQLNPSHFLYLVLYSPESPHSRTLADTMVTCGKRWSSLACFSHQFDSGRRLDPGEKSIGIVHAMHAITCTPGRRVYPGQKIEEKDTTLHDHMIMAYGIF